MSDENSSLCPPVEIRSRTIRPFRCSGMSIEVDQSIGATRVSEIYIDGITYKSTLLLRIAN